MNVPDDIKALTKEILVYDIETSSHDHNDVPIPIWNFESYLKHAKPKYIGFYSYKYEKYMDFIVKGNEEEIMTIFEDHKFMAGFNSKEFDTPIMYNTGFFNGYKAQIDIMEVLGYAKHKGHKNRAKLMGVKLKSNSLKHMAEAFKLDVQKGDIDYKIFHKNDWTDEEQVEIRHYLKADVMVTKQLIDKVIEFWYPFADMIDTVSKNKLHWITSSIAALTYKCACNTLGAEEIYGEKIGGAEKMGGRVITPKFEEARNVWYVDVRSLYPHIFAMFNLSAEVEGMTDEDFKLAPDTIWHGNDMFEVKGYYNISKPHPLAIDLMEKLKIRMHLKENDPNNPLAYAIKIFINSFYGAARSAVFRQIYTENGGWDCCWIGQQINKYMEKRMNEFGFETVAGDTDSIFCLEKEKWSKAYVTKCLAKIVSEINENVPLPQPTFEIEIENYLDYIMWPKDMKTGDFKKKNYVYIADDYIKCMGLPVIKDNATPLGKIILSEVLLPMIKEQQTAKFPREDLKYILNGYLERDDVIELFAKEFRVKNASSYKSMSTIQAQISEGYFNGRDGTIRLIKNKVYGKAGKSMKYCTVDEAKEHKLSIFDIDLDKINNELQPFCANGFMDDDKDRKVIQQYLDGKQKELDAFIESDLFDSYAVGDDIDDEEFIENEIFFEMNV